VGVVKNVPVRLALAAGLLAVLPAAAGAQSSSSSSSPAPATTTTSGDTGIWYVPTAEVLPARKWSISFQRTNIDDGQGFSDISTFPVTFGFGLSPHAELFGSWAVVTRIDRDSRPLFFSSPANVDNGTGGGILVGYPLNRVQWTGNQRGDLTVGGKFSLTPGRDGSARTLGAAVRAMVKLPVGSDDGGVSSGKTDFEIDGIVSSRNPVGELAGYGGFIVRGNPDGYKLSNGLRWGLGAAFPQKYNLGFRATAEIFGEHYFDKTITAPAGLTGDDGSSVPTSSILNSPVVISLGLNWQAPNGFFIGGAASWNAHMAGRSEAAVCGPGQACATSVTPFPDTPKDDKGLQVRIGFHPGARRPAREVARIAALPDVAPVVTPTAPAAPVAPPVTAPVRANRPPTVKAACDPCTVEVGKSSTVSADAQDPDGDPLIYRWTAPAGSLANPAIRQTIWTAPLQEGPVRVTVTVDDNRGGTASDSVVIQVVKPAAPVHAYEFEDVHFDFDRATLMPDAMRVLDVVAKIMSDDPSLHLEIEGHTCDIGTADYNLALGERRASVVRDYLLAHGVNPDRLRTVSYGEEQPQFDNAREDTRRLNRRSVLVVNIREK
jgi:outer membrane protein OmpA-like peptidoglycan-associated protein